jgi:hypothetical protein
MKQASTPMITVSMYHDDSMSMWLEPTHSCFFPFSGHVHGRYTRLHLAYGLPLSIASVCLYWMVIYASDNHLSSLPAWQQVMFPQLMYGTIVLGFGAWGLDAANRRRGSNVAADMHNNPLGMTWHCVIASFFFSRFFEWAYAFLNIALYSRLN